MRSIACALFALAATAQAQAAPCLDGGAATPTVYLAADGSGGLNVLSGPTVTLPDGSRTPYASLSLWPSDRLTAAGIYAVTTPTPPSGQSLTQVCYALADGAVTATPTYADIPAPTTISSAAFQARFTDPEQAAIWKAAAQDATGAIGAGLTKGLTAGTVDLTSTIVKTWMDSLVTAGAITADRETAILTP
jgi:hypothetical protein